MEEFFGRYFLGGFFWETFFGRIFLGGFFWEDFFGRIFLRGFFWEDFLGGFFGEEFFGRNYLVEINKELMFLQDFGVILSQCTGRKNFRSLEVRGKLIALKNRN